LSGGFLKIQLNLKVNMIFSKTLNFIKPHRKQFFRYFLVGSSGFLLDIGTLYVFKEVFGWGAVMAVAINQLIVIGYIFTLNKQYSFSAFGHTHHQLIKFLAVFALNYIIAIIWMWGWHEKAGFNYLLVRTANVALSVLWNFILYKIWVYRK